MLPLVRKMPANPRDRNFWKLLAVTGTRSRRETYDYVLYYGGRGDRREPAPVRLRFRQPAGRARKQVSGMPTAYDVVAYPGFPFAQTHPDRLATIATLMGMRPAPVERCRVLELACGDGGNLIPMAVELPRSRFTGVDLAKKPIASGKRAIADLGLKNITLKAGDLARVNRRWGEFDFIIAHGIYAWAPPAVQDHILRIACENLAPQGVLASSATQRISRRPAAADDS